MEILKRINISKLVANYNILLDNYTMFYQNYRIESEYELPSYINDLSRFL